MRNSKIVISIYLMLFVLISLVCAKEAITGYIAKSDFEVDSLLLKVSLKSGNSAERVVNIKSYEGGKFGLEIEDSDGASYSPDGFKFNLETSNLPGVSLSENEFVLSQGETKKVVVRFDTEGLSPGVYVGSIKINGAKESAELPVVFEVETKDVFFDFSVDIPLKYSEIKPGEKIIAEMNVIDVAGVGASDVEMEYYVKGFDGSILVSENERVFISDRARITKTLLVPNDLDDGNYVFSALAKYKSSIGVSSYVFKVDSSVGDEGAVRSSYIILLFVFFLAILGLFVYFVKYRDKTMVQLRKYNALELKRQKELLITQAKIAQKNNLATASEIKKEMKEKIHHLKREQNKRIKTLSKLKEKKDVQGMKKKLNEWTGKGYNTLALQYKLKALSVGDMKKIMSNLKTEGYKKGK